MVKPIPDGYHTVTPYLPVEGVADVLEYASRAFDAVVTERVGDDDGTILHAELQIGDSKIMLGEARGQWKPMPACLYLYVEDCDAAYAKALESGGRSIRPPENQYYGDRNAGVMDPAGNFWWLATHVEDVSSEELAERTRTRRRS